MLIECWLKMWAINKFKKGYILMKASRPNWLLWK